MIVRRLWLYRFVLCLCLVVVTLQARAQQSGFAMDRFEPAERGSRFFVADTLDLRGGVRPAFGATLDYAYKPLIVEDASGAERFALVRHQTFVHVGGSSIVLIDRLRAGLSVPLAIYQDGESGFVRGEELRGATAPAFGDVRLAFDVRVIGQRGDLFTLAAGARAWLPTGLRSQFTSDGSLRASPQILASGDLMSALTWAARLGVIYRSRDDAYAGNPLGSEILGQAGVGLRALSDRLLVGPELWASSVLSGGTAVASAIVGAHYEIVRASGVHVGLGIGTGLTRGYGSEQLRGLLAIEWASPFDAPTFDRDRDGIRDDVDACPDTPGVHDADPTANGCPPPPAVPIEDTDHDGISDMDDACPGIVGVRTSDPMTNGCPPSTAPRPLAVVTKAEIKIGEQLRFATDSAELLVESDAVLMAVKRILDEHPDIRRVRIEGHTDAIGDATYNEGLSTRRATAVAAWLTAHGVAASRLESAGFGSRRPIDTNETDAGRANNRRVVFTIVERAPPKP